MASPVGVLFLDHFAALRDPRQGWKVVFPLPEVLLVVLCGTIAGAEDFVEVRRWARLHIDFLRRFLPFAHGIPSHDTLNDIVNAIDGELLRPASPNGWPACAPPLRRLAPAPRSSPSTARPHGAPTTGRTIAIRCT